MNQNTPALGSRLRQPVRVLSIVGLLAVIPAQASALVVVDAAAFFGDCSSLIAVTEDTRVNGRATALANACSIDLDLGVTLEFRNAIVQVPDLSITGGEAQLRFVSSVIEALTGSLSGFLFADASSVSIVNSTLQAPAGDFSLFAGAVNVTSSRLVAGFVSISTVGDTVITNSRLESPVGVIVFGSTSVMMTGSALRADGFVSVSTTRAATIRNSQVHANEITVAGETSTTMTGSALIAPEFVAVFTYSGTAGITNSELRSSTGDLIVRPNTDATVAGSVLTAGGALQILADTGAVAIGNSRLHATGPQLLLISAQTSLGVASSVLSAAGDMLFEVVGPASVRTSAFAGGSVAIYSTGSTALAASNNFKAVTPGAIVLSGATGCTSVRNVPDVPCF